MIFIAGGAGYIGSHVNKFLNSLGYQTVVYDNLVYGHKEFVKWGEFVLGDLLNSEQLRLCFRKYPIEVVMHFSAFAYVGESVKDPLKYYKNNVTATLNLLEVMKEFGVRYFIFSSTCATYGEPQEIPITENHPQHPINPYGKSKLMIEEILQDFDHAYGIKHVNLRYFNAAGADPEGEIGEWHDPETHLIPLVLRVTLRKLDRLEVFGDDYPTEDGTCIRDYIHVMDLADAHVKAMEYLKKTNKSDSFNLGNERGYSVFQVIKKAEEITGRKIPYRVTARREGDPAILIADSTKAKNLLSWNPSLASLDEIIKTAWNWHKRLGF